MIEQAQPGPGSPLPPSKVDIVKSVELFVAALLSAMMLFSLCVRATHAGALWRDEAATLQLAQMPTVGELAANFQHEAFPIPFPLLIRGYTSMFGSSDSSLRWFGLAVGVAILLTAWCNACAVGGRGPFFFLILFGLNATFLIWGTSLRGYGLGCVFLLFTIGLTAKAIQQPTTANAIAATISAIASVQLMINAVPLIAAIATSAALLFALQRQYRHAMIVCVCAGICALSFVPYLHSYLSSDWNIVLKYPTDLSSLWGKLRLALEEHGPVMAIFWYAAAPFVLIVVIVQWSILRREKSSADAQLLVFLTCVSVLSIFGYYAFLKILSYATRSWYYLPLLCAVAGAIDLAGGILGRAQWFRVIRLLFAVGALLLLPLPLWNAARERLTDIDTVAQKLEREASPDDLIVLNPWHFAPSFYRYYHGATPWITVPTMSEHRVHRYDLMKSKMLEDDPLSDVRARIQQTLQSDHRVWVVGGARPPDPNMPRLGPAPNPYFGWAGYMSFWSMEIGSFLGAHAANGEVVLEPMPNVNDGENVPLLLASGWQD